MQMYPKLTRPILGLAAVAALAQIHSASAAPVPITNSGFEADFAADGTFPTGPITGWPAYDPFNLFPLSGNATGVINPTGTTYYIGDAPEGRNAAIVFLSGNIGAGPAGIRQFPGIDLEPDTLYTLTVEVGNIASGIGLPPFDSFGFFDLDGFPGYSVQILANGVVLGEDFDQLEIPEGEFRTSTVTAQVGPDSLILGFPIEIRLINLNTEDTPDDPGIEVNFDNVRFDASPAQTGPCNPADLAEPFGTLDLADINAFVAGFISQDPAADINPDGVFDLADINAFVSAFTTGCP